MKKKIIALSMIALLFVSVGCGKKEKTEKKEEVKANTSEDIIKNQVVDDMNITNVMMLIEGGETTFTCDVETKTQKDLTAKYVLIHVTDADGKELTNPPLTHAIDGVKAGQQKSVSITTDADLTNAKAVTYEFTNEVK